MAFARDKADLIGSVCVGVGGLRIREWRALFEKLISQGGGGAGGGDGCVCKGEMDGCGQLRRRREVLWGLLDFGKWM